MKLQLGAVGWGSTLTVAAVGLSLLIAPAPARRAPAAAPRAEPRWVTHDAKPFRPPPTAPYRSYIWDGADHTFLRPLSDALAVESTRESANVNALDEVPASSWYQNRLAVRELTPDEVARGACESLAAPPPPYTAIAGKPDGASPGLTVEDATGRRYMLKPDAAHQPERGTAADAVGAAVWHAAGFNAPCNRVVYLRPDDLRADEGGEVTARDVASVLAAGVARGDGARRFAMSEFVAGAPIGHWSYSGGLPGDLNDAIPNERRRELRAMRLLAAWLNRIDARAENTLATWHAGPDGGHVRYHLVDFGETLGVLHDSEWLSRRFGHSHYLDVEHLLVDAATLGTTPRPWHDARLGPAGETLGYWDVERFDPDAWRPGYPNPAFDQMTERDGAWMARVIARLDDADLRALAKRARFSDPVDEAELYRILRGRQRRLLTRWLPRRSPLAWPTVQRQGDSVALCAHDLMVRAGLGEGADRRYAGRARGAKLGEWTRRVDGWVCQDIRPTADVVTVTWSAGTRAQRPEPALQLTLARQSDGRHALVAAARRDSALDAPHVAASLEGGLAPSRWPGLPAVAERAPSPEGAVSWTDPTPVDPPWRRAARSVLTPARLNLDGAVRPLGHAALAFIEREWLAD